MAGARAANTYRVDSLASISCGLIESGGAAAYVDIAGAEAAVTKAIEAVDAADLGDEDAELIVGDALDHDLAWYANPELPFLLELL
jgi:hypothetical protein